MINLAESSESVDSYEEELFMEQGYMKKLFKKMKRWNWRLNEVVKLEGNLGRRLLKIWRVKNMQNSVMINS